jgi:hypothetical protein
VSGFIGAPRDVSEYESLNDQRDQDEQNSQPPISPGHGTPFNQNAHFSTIQVNGRIEV